MVSGTCMGSPSSSGVDLSIIPDGRRGCAAPRPARPLVACRPGASREAAVEARCMMASIVVTGGGDGGTDRAPCSWPTTVTR